MVIEGSIDDAQSHLSQVSSGFTAINHGPVHREQLLTPESSAAPSVRPNPASSRAISSPRRRHNPNVARYLGLGSTIVPDHLKNYAPRPEKPDSPSVESGRKRIRRADDEIIQRSSYTREPPGRPAASPLVPSPYSAQYSQATYDSNDSTSIMDDQPSPQPCFAQPEVSHVTPISTLDSETVRMNIQDAVKVPHTESPCLSLPDRGEGRVIGICPDTDDSNVLCRNNDGINTTGDDYEFDITDDELLTLTMDFDETCSDVPHSVSSSLAKSCPNDNEQMHASDDCSENAPEEAPAINTSQHTRKKFVSPVTLTTHLLAATGDGGSTNARTPIVRPAFPKPARDRSPIIGLSSNVVLRTCFRIGEALNQSHQASKSGQQMLIELYARVLASERTEKQQNFTFCDLFHAKPPYVKGLYDAVIWKAVPLFEYDSRRLLQQGRMCRCIGTMKRNGKERFMVIHNIWEATWEDIEWVEGIVSF
ncbi:hypothetical protein COCMIDRAFT_6562 [Bipolaris oryzae ATCC 44560]|uniref:Uncharacterized protein n=1 Tax=Bipolaris oryzae ATCC 44560 TaxID=930090 RepID=W6Z939_COCMI|nr:uncharacterized protein COCMIDRAFT_6562 [Bipolaris oryzae ATCC 44560]EUC44074.1 hypothetical protein COCMIDRAFT_6562 [Bipolaris oryzae ATCC 44560]